VRVHKKTLPLTGAIVLIFLLVCLLGRAINVEAAASDLKNTGTGPAPVQIAAVSGQAAQPAADTGETGGNLGKRARTPSLSPAAGQPWSGFNGRQNQGSQGVNLPGNYYGTQIFFFSLVLFVFGLAAYIRIKRKKTRIGPLTGRILLFILFGSAFIMKIYLAVMVSGHSFDLNTFRSWANAAANNLPQFYAGRNASDYPPLYIYVLYLIGKAAANPFLNAHYTFLLKIPSLLADLATSWLLYKLAKKYLSLTCSLLLTAFYLFNPAVFINSELWGQVDSFFTLIIVGAVSLLAAKKTGWAAVLFTAAVLMKPQGIIFLPVLGFELLRQKSFRALNRAVVGSLVTAVVIVLPFSLQMGPLWIFKLFMGTVGEYPYASVNAYNFYALLGANYVNDGNTFWLFSYHTWGMIFIVLITALAWLFYIKRGTGQFAAPAAFLLITGVFIFSVRMHERYLFPAVALSLLTYIYFRDRRILFLSAGFSLTSYLNTHFVLFAAGRGMGNGAGNAVLFGTSLGNVMLFIYLLKVLYDISFKQKIVLDGYDSEDSEIMVN
jgi:Gpi18-like mannosyltransferase